MTYTPVLQSDGSVGLRPVDGSKYTDVSYGVSRGQSRNWYMEAALNYNRSFGNHNIGALVLYNQSKEYFMLSYPVAKRIFSNTGAVFASVPPTHNSHG